MREREDLVELNRSVAEQLKQHGMIFNSPDPSAFRAALSSAGYYKQWKETFGEEAWTLLEKYSGPLT
jgi:TRAP-type C4-dicarboxylate transport system substrate-binding protein